jgi:Leucine-rich repeat (LRR) protein
MDYFYPEEKRNKITTLDIDNKNLQGSLNLAGFINLKELDCFYNKLTSLGLSDSVDLQILYCFNNQLADLNFSNNLNEEKLTSLSISDNNITSDLTPLSKFINLEILDLNNNNFTGSLESLLGMTKLRNYTLATPILIVV